MRIVLSEEKARPDGGQERCMLEVAEGLAARGHDLDLLYRLPGAFLERYDRIGCRTHRVDRFLLDPAAPLASGRELLATATAAVRQHPDLLYVNDYQHAPYGVLARARARCPLVAGLYLLPPPNGWARQHRVTIGRVDRFVAVASHVRTKFADAGVAPDRIDVVHIGVDVDRYRPATAEERGRERRALGVDDDELLVMFSGRIDHVKGIEVLLAAMNEVVATHPRARLLVAGSPVWHEDPAAGEAYLERLRTLAPPTTRWLPSQLDVVPLYQAADVVVVPSLWEEPFSRVVIEAMACGTPVIGSRAGGTPEALTGPLRPLLVETGDAGDLAARLRWFADEGGDLGATARRHVLASFTHDVMIDGFEASFERAGSGR